MPSLPSAFTKRDTMLATLAEGGMYEREGLNTAWKARFGEVVREKGYLGLYHQADMNTGTGSLVNICWVDKWMIERLNRQTKATPLENGRLEKNKPELSRLWNWRVVRNKIGTRQTVRGAFETARNLLVATQGLEPEVTKGCIRTLINYWPHVLESYLTSFCVSVLISEKKKKSYIVICFIDFFPISILPTVYL